MVVNGCLQYLLHRRTNALPMWLAQTSHFAGRTDTGEEQALAGVDVADAYDYRGIHEEVFHRFAQSTRPLKQVGSGKGGRQWFRSEMP